MTENLMELRKFLDESNTGDIVYTSSSGEILTGEHLVDGKKFGLSSPVIIRLNGNGRLDGGKLPAAEYPGFTAYMINGKYGREPGLPALAYAGFSVHEYWENGKFLYKKENILSE